MKKTKRDTSIARNIWKDFYGDIPKDKLGRSYEIHHIDGNCQNNDLTNLACVSIDEHYNIHLSKGEIASAKLILNRLNSDQTIKEKTRWIYKDGKELLISISKIDQYLKLGWQYGMISAKGINNPMHKSNGITPPSLNKVWISNQKEDRLINKIDLDDYIQSGWIKGRYKTSGTNNKKTFLGRTGTLHPKSKIVYKIDVNTHTTIKKYNGIREAMRDLDKKTTNISKACKSYEQFKLGLIKLPSKAAGFYWSYKNNIDE
jgi:hypothetical protein